MSIEPGPTGKFPFGKLRPDDKGELAAKFFARGGIIYIEFGKAVEWLALPPKDAREFARLLIEKADQIDRHLNNS